jgi:RNA polymerase sigma-70 factor (ECF subfamily)
MSTDVPRADERSRRRSLLMKQAQDGDREAYRALLEDVGPMIQAFLRKRVRDPDDLADAYQDALLSLHRARHTYDPARAFEPWAFAIARNAATDQLRRRLTRLSHETVVEDLPEVPAESAMEGTERLTTVLASLPPNQREAFELLKIEGLSVEAAAERVGTTPGALKVRAHRAYKVLRAMLGGER